MSEKQDQALNQQPAMNQQLQPQQPIPQPAVQQQPTMQQQPAMLQLPQQQAQVWPTTQQPIVLQMTTRNQPIVIQNYNSARSRALGITQLVCGIAAVVFNIIGIIIHATAPYVENVDSGHYNANYYWNESIAFYIGSGIWCSILVILSGSFAVCAGKKKTKCWIVTHLVFAILGSIFAGIMFGHACGAVAEDARRLENGFDVHGYRNYYHDDKDSDYNLLTFYASKSASRAQGSLFISIMFLLVTACSLIACIWSSTLCCSVVCCGSTPTAAASVRYMANPAGQQQMMILGANGQTFAAPQLMQNPGTTYMTQPTLPPAYIPQTGQMPAQMLPVQGSVVQQPYTVQQAGAPPPAAMTTSPPAYQ